MPDATITSRDGTKLLARYSGSGSPVVLVHGALGDRESFALIEAPLAARHTVWVYSRRGRGGSGDGPEYTLAREVEDVLAVLDAAGGGAHLVGHSMGGLYALMAAAKAPLLRSLVVYEPVVHLDRGDAAVVGAVQSALEAGDHDHALELFFPLAGILEHELKAVRTLEPVWQRMRRGVALVPREDEAIRSDPRARLSGIEPPDVPMLYLHGEHTNARVYPSLDEVARVFPNARVHSLSGQRHLAHAFDAPAFARAVLSFTSALEG